jgi:hypothetical protein
MLPNGLTSALVMGIFLLIVTLLAVTAGTRGSDAPVGRYTQLLSAGMAYLVVIISVFTNNGLGLINWLLLLVALALPILAGAATRTVDVAENGTADGLLRATRTLCALLIIIIQLTVAGQLISLTAGLQPQVVSITLGLTVTCYVIGRGWRGAARTSRWLLVWVGLAVLTLIGGLFLGTFGSLAAPALPTVAVDIPVVAGVFVAVVLLGAMDTVIRRTLSDPATRKRSVIGGGALLLGSIAALTLGIMLVFGGSIYAPNEPILTAMSALGPIGLAILSGLWVALLAATTDSYLAAAADDFSTGASKQPEPLRQRLVLGLGAVAIVVSIFTPPITVIFVVAAIIAAAGVGGVLAARSGVAFPPIALVIGVATSLVVAIAAGLQETLSFGSWTALALILGLAASYLTAVGFARITATHEREPARPAA